ncbi:MAG: galactose-1-phosphate uridylyltransferase [Bacteroidota bacterium]
MPELRRDPASRSWVVIATERSRRPSDFRVSRDERKGGACPFCYGNEHMTPPEVLALGRDADAPNEKGWSVRVVPNKFPALALDAGDGAGDGWGADGGPDGPGGLYEHLPAVGVHEVLVESPDHDSTLGTHSQSQMEDVLEAMVARARALSRNDRLRYLQIFKNWGRVGGASLEHTHCQLIATPIVPAVIEEELAVAREHYDRTGECLYCDIVRAETAAGARVMEESDHFLVFCPYAARLPFETWVVPVAHGARFEDIDGAELADLARVLRRTVRRFELAFEALPYNLIWHTSPWTGDFGAYYHWHLELVPRLAILAGFELGTGYYINPTAPEAAAASLREYAPESVPETDDEVRATTLPAEDRDQRVAGRGLEEGALEK